MNRLNYYRDIDNLARVFCGRPLDALDPIDKRIIFTAASHAELSAALAETARDLDEATTIEALLGIRDGVKAMNNPYSSYERALQAIVLYGVARKLLSAPIDCSSILAVAAAEEDADDEQVGRIEAAVTYAGDLADDLDAADAILDAAGAAAANKLTRRSFIRAYDALRGRLEDYELPALHNPTRRRTDSAVRTAYQAGRVLHRKGAKITYWRANHNAVRAKTIAGMGLIEQRWRTVCAAAAGKLALA